MEEIFVVKKVSTKTGKPYIYMGVDLGYAVKAITFDVQTIAEVLGVPVIELMGMGINEKRVVGTLGVDK